LLETKFGIHGLFLWDKPKLFPYPSGKFGDLGKGEKGIMRIDKLLLNRSVNKE
jgi:hypothetical protein